jgi:undecaprenyl-phosphate alpha-N-acetylglucosaminyl 1-phosphatetransferase
MIFIRAALAFLAALGVTVLVLPRLGHLARNIGLLDMPNERKVHNSPKPLVGGLGIVLGLLFSSLLFVPLTYLRGYYAGVFSLVIIGFFDDFRELNHRWKFVAQFFAAALMIYFSHAFLFSFGDLLWTGPVYLGAAGIPMTIFCAVGVINAVNMVDGLDGLAGGISLIAFLSFAFLAYVNNQPELMLLSLALAGAVIGFIRYNWYPAKLFLGDGGSLLLGFSVAFLSIAVTQKEGGLVPPVAALLVVAFPVADAVTVMLKRGVKGRSPFYADKTHFHHILLLLGYCKRSADRTIFAVSGLLSAVAVLGTLYHVREAWLFLVFCLFFVTHFVFSFNFRKILRYRAGLVKGGMPCFYRAVERIGYFSNIDRITGLLNKKALLSNLECELTISRKQQTDLSVLLIDIDHFKRINNLHGRDAGDRVLNHMSQVIRDTIRKTDIAGRYESDKFLLILQETTFAGAVKLAGKISSIVSNMEIRTEGNRSVRLSLSYGAGTADSLTDTAGKLIDSAEESLGVGNEINVGRVRKSESLPYSEMLTKHHSARPAE